MYLYNLGDECNSITGGWVDTGFSKTIPFIKNPDNMYAYATYLSVNYLYHITTTNKIDFSGYNTFYCDVTDMNGVRSIRSMDISSYDSSQYVSAYLLRYDNGNDYFRVFFGDTYTEVVAPKLVVNTGIRRANPHEVYIHAIWLEK